MRFHETELLNTRTLGSGYTTLIASKNLDAPPILVGTYLLLRLGLLFSEK